MYEFIAWLRTARGFTVLTGASLLFVLTAVSCSSTSGTDEPDFDVDEILVELLGGETTAFLSQRDAFTVPVSNLADSDKEKFEIGEALFLENWTPPTGLGPLFNAHACAICHENNGRAQPPASDGLPARGLLLRLSIPGPDGPLPEPNYGLQLQDEAVEGVDAEGTVRIIHEEITGEFADGTPYTLLKPTYVIEDLAYGPLHPDTMISPRIATAIIGMGLLEAIPEDDLLSLVDPNDADGDGISGRMNVVPNRRTGMLDIGRFGWKAGQPTVEQQAADAFNGDLGITTFLYPVERCTAVQQACQDAAGGPNTDLAIDRITDIGVFSRLIAVTAMRGVDDPQVRRGATVFLSSGCSSCHTPKHTTGEHAIDALAGQSIFPYTDLLLHDMGDGLADNRPEFEASGREWRTAPLWGVGLIEKVNGHTRYLHDGRARSLTEAILWHDGEAEESKNVFKNLSAAEREALIAFLLAL